MPQITLKYSYRWQPAQTIAIIAELIGAAKPLDEVMKRDNSGVSSFTKARTLDTIEKNTLVQARLGRVVPVNGLIGTGVSLYQNFKPVITINFPNK